jgi:hypothetical protein
VRRNICDDADVLRLCCTYPAAAVCFKQQYQHEQGAIQLHVCISVKHASCRTRACFQKCVPCTVRRNICDDAYVLRLCCTYPAAAVCFKQQYQRLQGAVHVHVCISVERASCRKRACSQKCIQCTVHRDICNGAGRSDVHNETHRGVTLPGSLYEANMPRTIKLKCQRERLALLQMMITIGTT